jgi:peptidoglycan/LPS O-acetylase OafA/YrhL
MACARLGSAVRVGVASGLWSVRRSHAGVEDSRVEMSLLDGHFAVFIFFVLSGFALTTKFVEKPANYSVMQAVAARYFRLAPPIAVVCVIAYAAVEVAPDVQPAEAATLTRLPEWLGSFYTFDASVSSLSKFSLYWVFFKYDLAVRSYNSNLMDHAD